MKISKARLKSTILEELQNVMGEMFYDDDTDDDSDWYDDREDEDPVLALINPVKRYFKPVKLTNYFFNYKEVSFCPRLLSSYCFQFH